MSYCSENKLPLETSKCRLFEIIELLGFKKMKDSFKSEGEIGSYFWSGNDENISFVGIELYVYKFEDCFSVQTRTRAGRSYWDLQKQNETISLLRSLFGGSFNTDEGEGRYWNIEEPEPTKIESSLYVNRWIFNNAVMKAKVYLSTRNLTGDIARETPTGILWIDDINPRVLSNNILLPYIIGCWESYFRNSFVSIVKYVDNASPAALKRCNITTSDYMRIIHGERSLEYVLADSLSFQRPSVISQNFKSLDLQIDIAACLKKPYHGRKKTLFDSLTEIIEKRDVIVHAGKTDTSIFDRQIHSIITDLTEAVDRSYREFGRALSFQPSFDF